MLFCYVLGILTGGLAYAGGRALQRFITAEVRSSNGGRYFVFHAGKLFFCLQLKEARS